MSEVRFYGLTFRFEPGQVFRPRPTSEKLVRQALSILGRRSARVADVGTGSGAIAVAIAVNAPAVTVYACDTNPAAAAVAHANAVAHDVAHRVAVCEGWLLESLPRELDLIVADLPYLSDAVAAGEDGLELIRALIAAAPAYMTEDGHVLLQYRGRVYEASTSELGRLLERIERDSATSS